MNNQEYEPIKIRIVAVPPVKQPGMSGSIQKENKRRREKLQSEAVKVAKDTGRALELYKKGVKLTIVYSRFRGRADAANIIGGIADALQGPFYLDDRQLLQVHYTEKMNKKRDEYEISLEIVSS